MRHYCGIASEQEVLFLPLSSFKVTHLDESTFQKKKGGHNIVHVYHHKHEEGLLILLTFFALSLLRGIYL